MRADRRTEQSDERRIAAEHSGKPANEVADIVGVAVADRPASHPIGCMLTDMSDHLPDRFATVADLTDRNDMTLDCNDVASGVLRHFRRHQTRPAATHKEIGVVDHRMHMDGVHPARRQPLESLPVDA